MAAPQEGQVEAPGYTGWPQRAQVVTLILSFEHPPATAPSAVNFPLSLDAACATRKERREPTRTDAEFVGQCTTQAPSPQLYVTGGKLLATSLS